MTNHYGAALTKLSVAAANLRIWAVTLDVIAELNRRQIQVMVLKSLPQVEDLYGQVGGRYTADVDLFVPAERAAEVADLILSLGWKVHEDEWSRLPTSGGERSVAISRRPWHFILPRAGEMSGIDLHTDQMDPWVKRVLDATLWTRGVYESRDDVHYLVPGPEDRLVFLCWHFFSDSVPRGMQWDKLTDISLILSRAEELDWTFVARRAREAGVMLCLLLACELAANRSNTPISPIWRSYIGSVPRRHSFLSPILRRSADRLTSRQRLILWLLMQDQLRVMLPVWRERLLPRRNDIEARVGHPLSSGAYAVELVRTYLRRFRHPTGGR